MIGRLHRVWLPWFDKLTTNLCVLLCQVTRFALSLSKGGGRVPMAG